MAIVLALGGGAALPTATPAKRAPSRLRAFSSCPALVGYAKGHFGQTHGAPAGGVTPLGEPAIPGRAPTDAKAPTAVSKEAAPTYSTTNIQEEGVDEPDLVKTDGATIFTVAGDTLYAVAATGPGAPRIAGSLKLGRPGGDLLLHGQRLLVIQSASPPIAAEPVAGGGAPRLAVAPVSGQTILTEVDVGDPAAMKVTHTLTVDGQFVDARQNGATARVVISSTPRAYTVAGVRGRASGWLPRSRFASRISGRHRTRTMVACRAMRRPPVILGPGHGDDRHRRSRQGPVGGRRRRRDGRCADRLRLDEPSVRRDPALDRPADGAQRPADDHDGDRPLRRLRPRPRRPTRRAARCPATC